MKSVLMPTLLELLLLGGRSRPLEISTSELAKRIGKSQQAASKHLSMLEKEGYLERIRSGKRTSVRLTEKGVQAVMNIYSAMRGALEEVPPSFEITGTVFTGLREGAYYVSLKGYRKQFVSKLGFDPYPGTLNLRLTSSMDRMLRRELGHRQGIFIQGFEDEKRSYSPAKCFETVMNDRVKGAAIIIERTHYDDSVLEVISPVCVRDALELKDGDQVRARILLPTRKS